MSPQQPLPIGAQAPDFSLPSTPDQRVALSDLRGQPVVLAFYPADWSPVCGDEMVLFQEVFPEIRRYNAELLGISVDGVWCHLAFARDRKLNLSTTGGLRAEGAGCPARTARIARPKGRAPVRCPSSTATASSTGATSRPSA